MGGHLDLLEIKREVPNVVVKIRADLKHGVNLALLFSANLLQVRALKAIC